MPHALNPGAPADAVGWLFGVQMSALKIYILGRCTVGQEEVEALTEAYHRYANRAKRRRLRLSSGA